MSSHHTILLIHGANLNLLGKRNPVHYGNFSLEDIVDSVREKALDYDFEIIDFQSNHEGAIIDFIQRYYSQASGIIINAGAFTHYSYAITDALVDSNLPVVEVHLSNLKNREIWRQHSVIKNICISSIDGLKELGYIKAVEKIANKLGKNTARQYI